MTDLTPMTSTCGGIRRRSLLGPAWLAAGAAAMAAMLAACGGGSEGPKPPEPVRAASTPDGGAAAGEASTEVIEIPERRIGSQDWAPSGPDDDPTIVKIGGLHSRKPASWTWQQPTMQFRRLQYAVPGRGDAGAAELVFSVFIGTEGGPTELNVERWNRQFLDEQGEPTSPVRREELETTMPTLLVEHQGDYLEMGAAAPRTRHRQLAAVIQAPGRRIFVRLVGPDATVDANRGAFLDMIGIFREAMVPLPGSPVE